MDRVQRIDRGRAGKAERLPSGFLRIPGHATRVGVFVYRNADGTSRRELRLPEEVFAPESLATLRGAPVTDDHPPVMLTPENARAYARGSVGDDVSEDGELVAVAVTVTDGELIAKIDDRRAEELSCGYSCDLELTAGEHPRWGRYDVIQRNIRHNHLAVVEAGRAGPAARLRLDAAEQDPDTPDPTPHQEDTPMVSITLNGITFQVEPQVAQAIAAERADSAAKLTAAQADATAKAGELEKATGRADSAEAKVQELEKARTDSAANIPALVAARTALVAQATPHLDADTAAKVADLADDALRAAVIKAAHPELDLAGKSPEYVLARYDGALEVLKVRAGASSAQATGDAVNGAKDADKRNDAAEDPRARMIAANRAATAAK